MSRWVGLGCALRADVSRSYCSVSVPEVSVPAVATLVVPVSADAEAAVAAVAALVPAAEAVVLSLASGASVGTDGSTGSGAGAAGGGVAVVGGVAAGVPAPSVVASGDAPEAGRVPSGSASASCCRVRSVGTVGVGEATGGLDDTGSPAVGVGSAVGVGVGVGVAVGVGTAVGVGSASWVVRTPSDS